MPQTCMNEQPKLNAFRGNSSAEPNRRARTVIHAKRPALRQLSAEPSRPSIVPDSYFRPARGLMICLGGCAFSMQLSRMASTQRAEPSPMKLNSVVVAIRPRPVVISPQKRVAPSRRLRISLWQADSWTKKVINLRDGPQRRENARMLRQRAK